MKEAAGMSPRRSASLLPQIQPTEDCAGATCRRNPCLHLQIQASEEGAGVTRGTPPTAVASLPDGDDMLREILLRLPPQPSSLPRASVVCKRWLGLVTDPKFHRQFYAHHRKPPLLGIFHTRYEGIVFTSVLDRPDRIHLGRFDFGCYGGRGFILDCRHGRVLVKDPAQDEVLVCDPITGEQRRIAVPPEFNWSVVQGAVLCAASDHGHLHGGCHTSPFKVVLMSTSKGESRARVYSSEAGGWGNLVTVAAPRPIFGTPSDLVGNCLYWMHDDIPLQFDLVENSLTVISRPPVTHNIQFGNHLIIQTENGTVGFVMLSHPCFQIWQRNVNDLGGATWVLWKTIEMHDILGLALQIWGENWLLGYDQDNDVIFLYVNQSVYTVQLKSMQSKKLYETNDLNCVHPFTSFYTPAIRECDEPNMLHNP